MIVTTGSSGGFPLAFLASFDAGDRVALAAPGYPAYRNILAALNLEAVDLPTSAADRFQPTVEALEKAGRIDGLIVASPSNPTGTMVGHAEMKALADWCTANGVRLISDEIYHGIVYEGDTVSAVEVSDSAIVVNSFSKYFSMTGWRVGWLVVPPDLVRPIERLAQNFFISVPTLSQHAALAAFDCRDELDGHVRRYRTNRDLLLAGLPAAGLDRFAPAEGAFYLYCDVAHLTNDSREFCRRMLARGRRGDDARRRLRSRARRRHAAHLLRRLDRRDGRGGAAAQGVEAGMRLLAMALVAARRVCRRSPRAARASIAPRPRAPSSGRSARIPSSPRPTARWRRPMPRSPAKLSGPAKDDLEKEQVRWIGDRNRACAADADGIAPCLKRRYAARTTNLQAFAEGIYPFISEQSLTKSGKLGKITYSYDIAYPQFDGHHRRLRRRQCALRQCRQEGRRRRHAAGRFRARPRAGVDLRAELHDSIGRAPTPSPSR